MTLEQQNFILLAVDTAGIQSYIFGSNRLKENVGASYLVKQATEDWAFDALEDPDRKINVQNRKLINTMKIEDGALAAEVLYAGGGNFIVLFRDNEAAKGFTRKLSEKVLTHAPGLRLDIYQEPFEWTGTGLGIAVKLLLQNMRKERGKKAVSAPLMGLSVTVMCQSTALPSVEIIHDPDGNERYVSAEVYAKYTEADNANHWLRRELPPGESYDYPPDLDDLGRSIGERSYIAVVHADGNGMGQEIRKIGLYEDNRTYIQKMRDFSERVKAISSAAMKTVINLLVQKSQQSHKIIGTRTVSDVVFSWNDSHKMILPIRPIVFGGDDTTFVCDGRIGLSLAVTYLQAFEKEAAKQQMKLSACAGIAIVKSHYPFARAYQLSEELCDEAKKFRRENLKQGGGALDWYFTTGGLYDDLEAMREREYTVKLKQPSRKSSTGSLTLRPISLSKEGGVRSWNEIERLTIAFQNDWANRRNKAKAFRDALREGPEAVKRFRIIYIDNNDPDQPKIPHLAEFGEDGWHDDHCGYFDALELMDIHIPLNEKEK